MNNLRLIENTFPSPHSEQTVAGEGLASCTSALLHLTGTLLVAKCPEQSSQGSISKAVGGRSKLEFPAGDDQLEMDQIFHK